MPTGDQRKQWRNEKAVERARKMAAGRCLFSGCHGKVYKNRSTGVALRFCSKHRTRKSRNLPLSGR